MGDINTCRFETEGRDGGVITGTGELGAIVTWRDDAPITGVDSVRKIEGLAWPDKGLVAARALESDG